MGQHLSEMLRCCTQFLRPSYYDFFKNKLDSEVEFLNEQKSLVFINGFDQNHLRKQVRLILDKDSVLESSLSSYKYVDRWIYVGEWGYGHVPPSKDTIVKVVCYLKKYGFDRVSMDFLEGLEDNGKKNLVLSESSFFESSQMEVYSTVVDDFLIVRTNLSDYFKGFQLKISLMDSVSGDFIATTDFLMGSHLLQGVFNMSKYRLDGKLVVRVLVEDIYGEEVFFDYSLKKTIIPNKVVKC